MQPPATKGKERRLEDTAVDSDGDEYNPLAPKGKGRQGPAIDSDDNELSDEDEDDPKGDHHPKNKRKRTLRRFTIEPVYDKDGFQLVYNDDTPTPFDHLAVAENPDLFLASMTAHPEDWYHGVVDLLDAIKQERTNRRLVESQNEQLSKDWHDSMTETLSLKKIIQDLKTSSAKDQVETERLRDLRNKYRRANTELMKENAELKSRHQPSVLVDSDDDQLDSGVRHLDNSRQNTPISTIGRPGTNYRYPDAAIFSGNRDEFEGWCCHIDSKLTASAELFPREQDRINYVRDRCKSAAFETIKTRSTPGAVDPYLTLSELMEDLDHIFGNFDKLAKCNAELNDPKFGMGERDPKETFEEFLTRFTTTIAPLNLPEMQKIWSLQRTITTVLRHKLNDGTTMTSYRDTVARLRRIDTGYRQIESSRPKKDTSASARSRTSYNLNRTGNTADRPTGGGITKRL